MKFLARQPYLLPERKQAGFFGTAILQRKKKKGLAAGFLGKKEEREREKERKKKERGKRERKGKERKKERKRKKKETSSCNWQEERFVGKVILEKKPNPSKKRKHINLPHPIDNEATNNNFGFLSIRGRFQNAFYKTFFPPFYLPHSFLSRFAFYYSLSLAFFFLFFFSSFLPEIQRFVQLLSRSQIEIILVLSSVTMGRPFNLSH